MVWEKRIRSIVMLTNVIEGASRMVGTDPSALNTRSTLVQTKCHQYWPDLHQTVVYGVYQITCMTTENSCDYEKRSFQLTAQVSCVKRCRRSSIARG